MCKNAGNIDLNSLGNPEFTRDLRSILRDFFYLCDTKIMPSQNRLVAEVYRLYRESEDQALWMDGGHSVEIAGYENQSENVPSELIFKFADLDKIPDEDVDAVLQVLKK